MKLTVIIPVYNSSKLLGETLASVRAGIRLPDELIVVDDASTDDSPFVAAQFGARVIVMPANEGPAACRNEAALLSHGDILVFLDADTCVHPDTLQQIERHFAKDESLTAVIGSYDDTPRDPRFCSQYRNLAHCYVHRSSHRAALTFWSGCGAVRRAPFFAVDGFDEEFRHPSIEDIELGYRLSDHGARILLDPAICVTHTKHWTLWSILLTDVAYRGIPWMALLLERGSIPDDLNIKRSHRIATILTGAALTCAVLSIRSIYWWIPTTALAALALSMDAGLMRFIYRQRGARLLVVAAGMTLIQNVCKLVATVGGVLRFLRRRSRSVQRRSRLMGLREEETTRAITPASSSLP